MHVVTCLACSFYAFRSLTLVFYQATIVILHELHTMYCGHGQACNVSMLFQFYILRQNFINRQIAGKNAGFPLITDKVPVKLLRKTVA